MKDLFFANVHTKEEISWNNLIEDILKTTTYSTFAHYSNYYQYFKHLIVSLLIDKPIILFDSDFTEHEINNLIKDSNLRNEIFCFNNFNIKSKNELIHKIVENNYKHWNIVLFTSGTTGLPKMVKHTYRTITRNVRVSEKHMNDIWGFAYNATHMAGIQVFFQALLNGNTMVQLYNLSPNDIKESILKYNITHISATPTFYNLNFSEDSIFYSVKSITTGGERLNEKIISKLKNIFPNAKIYNIYALTEAGSLLNSKDDKFVIYDPEKIKIENNVLYIHRSLLGDFNFCDEWYNTGDIVEIINNNPLTIRFIARDKELINVGGFKVNPYEVEDALKHINGIVDAVVYSKKSSVLGNIVCADVLCNINISEQEIRRELQKVLQEYKIPRIINFVKEIKLNRASKIQRL
ncbi:MAG: fatty acid--CoA ligase family protein [Bacteroidales bacterium]|nr:fatty acid--CoA ligase family protein [Bacteroidales bacterium]